MHIVKLLLVCALAVIFVQDFKEQLVYWFLYPLMGVLTLIIQIEATSIYLSIVNSFINLIFIFLILFVSYLYARFKIKKDFLDEVFGLGDVLFFIFICFSFSTISFLVLFVISLLFSLLLHTVLTYRRPKKIVPLAGYMSLFFGMAYILSFSCKCNFLYIM